MTDAEKRELEALRAKKQEELTDAEKARLEALEKKAEGEGDKSYSESYVKQLRQESAKYRTRAKEVEELLAKFDGIDPEEFHKIKESQKKAEKDKLEKKGEWDKLRDQLIEEHKKEGDKWAKEKAEQEAKYAQLESELNDIVLAHEIGVAATVAKAINPKLVEMVAKSLTKVTKMENGQRVVRVLDGSGNERVDLKTGKLMEIPQLLQEMKESEGYAHLFAGGKAGAGSNTTFFDGKKIKNPWAKDSFNLTEQGRIYKENPQMAERLKAEAKG